MKRAVVWLVLALTALGVCGAQDAASVQRLMGTWTDHEGKLWIFQNDGKLIIDDFDTVYAVTGAQVQVVGRYNTGNSSSPWEDCPLNFDLALSDDGKTINLSGNYGNDRYSPRFNNPSLQKIEIDQTLNGTWIFETGKGDAKMRWENTYNNGVFEVVYNGVLNMRGIYTTSDGKISIKRTHHFNRDHTRKLNDTKWQKLTKESYTEEYSIRGKKLILKNEDGVPMEFTKK